jgi:hypothetical protein
MPAVFDAPIDWSYPCTERYTHRTNVRTARSGVETRANVRLIPRRAISFVTRVADKDQAARLALMLLSQDEQWIVPFWPEAVVLATAVASAATATLTLTTVANREFIAGGYAVLWVPGRAMVAIVIATVTGSTLVVTGPGADWPAGTRVIPGVTGRWFDDPGATRPNAYIGGAAVTFLCDAVPDPDITVPTASGAAVFSLNPHRVELKDVYERLVSRFDSPSFEFSDTGFGRHAVRNFEITMRTLQLSDRDTVRTFWHQRRGAYQAFYLPSYSDDFDHLVDIGSGDSTVTIAACNYTVNGFPHEARRHVGLIVNGAITHRQVLNSVTVDAATEVLTLSTTAGVAKTRGHGLLSCLLYGRFAADDLVITYSNAQGVADIVLPFIELAHEIEVNGPPSGPVSPPNTDVGTPPGDGEPDPDDPDDPDDPTLPLSGIATFPPFGMVSVPIRFRVTARDANGIRVLTGGATVAAAVTGASSGSATITDNNNGTYDGTYTPPSTATGTHTFAITLNGTPISGSPKTVIVSAATPAATACSAVVGNATVDEVHTITITLKDAAGRTLGAQGTVTPTVIITGANAATLTPTWVAASFNWRASRTPGTAGTDSVAIAVGGTAISGSPYVSIVTGVTATASPPVVSGLSLICHYDARAPLPTDRWVSGTAYGCVLGVVRDFVAITHGQENGRFWIRVPSSDGGGSGGLLMWLQQNELPELNEIMIVQKVSLGSVSGAANYQNHPVGTKINFVAVGSKADPDNQVIISVKGNGSGVTIASEFELAVTQQNFINRTMQQNMGSAKFQCGINVENIITFYAKLNTIGTANGLLRVSLGNTQVMNYTNVTWRTQSNPSGFYKFQEHTVFGGNTQGRSIKNREDRLYVNDVKIYGVRL